MEKQGWKTTAIIFIVLFALETSFFIWAISSYMMELDKTNECYYDICSEYPQALMEDNVCYCYDLSSSGEFVVSKTKFIK